MVRVHPGPPPQHLVSIKSDPGFGVLRGFRRLLVALFTFDVGRVSSALAHRYSGCIATAPAFMRWLIPGRLRRGPFIGGSSALCVERSHLSSPPRPLSLQEANGAVYSGCGC